MHFREATQYQPGLLRLFETEKTRIQTLLPDSRIEHIGASALEGAIQLVENGSEFEFFIHFRDRMRADPQLVEEYNELKRKCTGMEPDAYRAVKSAFVERVLRSFA